MTAVIETTGLTKRYKRQLALDGVTLSVPKGSCFGLLGPNGAGKSTLVKTLLGIVHATSGEAKLMGRDFRSREARRGIGYLPEGHQFPAYLSGEGICRYFGKLAGLHGTELDREVHDKLKLVGMLDRAADRVTTYSKGMKQRVGIAQAMLGSPSIIFLDEPTDGVDPVGRKEIRDVIAGICERGTTVFLNSHLLSEVEMVCDRLAILARGKLLMEGTVAEIIERNRGFSGVSVRIRTKARIEGPLWSALETDGASAIDDHWFEIPLTDIDELSGVIDRLRADGVMIQAIQPRETSLEEAFVHLIEGEGAASAQEAPRA